MTAVLSFAAATALAVVGVLLLRVAWRDHKRAQQRTQAVLVATRNALHHMPPMTEHHTLSNDCRCNPTLLPVRIGPTTLTIVEHREDQP